MEVSILRENACSFTVLTSLVHSMAFRRSFTHFPCSAILFTCSSFLSVFLCVMLSSWPQLPTPTRQLLADLIVLRNGI